MRMRLFLGTLAFGFLVLCVRGQTPDDKSKPGDAGQSAVTQNTVPEELQALNRATRKMYAGGRARELATIPIVIIVSGDDLILRKNGKRVVATVIPREYHALKCIAHSMLGLFTHLAHEPGKPLDEERIKTLKEYRDLLVAAGPAARTCGFDADTLARQERIIARGLAFIDAVLKDGQVSADDLAKYCRASRPDVLANAAAAARAQLVATHRQVMAWKKDMTAEEWSALTVIVQGMQTPRAENAAVQYFARLFGETNGEGRRIVYAEALWDEEQAMNLLGTLRLDGKLSIAVFGDPFRMYRDLLADVARPIIDEILAAP
jgi:hypothetical protein